MQLGNLDPDRPDDTFDFQILRAKQLTSFKTILYAYLIAIWLTRSQYTFGFLDLNIFLWFSRQIGGFWIFITFASFSKMFVLPFLE